MTAALEQLVSAGDLVGAARLLGRPFEVEGVVVEGDRRGKLLGFPTANLDVGPGQLLPPKGVYAGAALDHRAAISIGVNPHYGGKTLRVEAYLLDFHGDLYDRALEIDVLSRLRATRPFADVKELKEQIRADVEDVRRVAKEDSRFL